MRRGRRSGGGDGVEDVAASGPTSRAPSGEQAGDDTHDEHDQQAGEWHRDRVVAVGDGEVQDGSADRSEDEPEPCAEGSHDHRLEPEHRTSAASSAQSITSESSGHGSMLGTRAVIVPVYRKAAVPSAATSHTKATIATRTVAASTYRPLRSGVARWVPAAMGRRV